MAAPEVGRFCGGKLVIGSLAAHLGLETGYSRINLTWFIIEALCHSTLSWLRKDK